MLYEYARPLTAALAVDKSVDGSQRQQLASERVFDDDVTAAARRERELPPCASDGTRAKSFLLVFVGHSGSSAIVSELRAHSQTHIELAEPVDHQETFDTDAALKEARGIFERGVKEGKTAGFKMRPMHIMNKAKEWAGLAREFETRILWQYRKNLFKATVGEYAYRVLNDTTVVEGLRKPISKEERCSLGAGCRYRISDLRFVHETLKSKVRMQNQITAAVEVIDGGRGCVREVAYEDYLYHREDTVGDVQKFLGFRMEKTEPGRFKATGDNLCEVVENWDEVCRHFYGCFAWQHMLDDVRNQCFCKYSGGPSGFCEM